MNLRFGKAKSAGFTLLELLVIIAVILILVALYLPTRNIPDCSLVTGCMSNQRQILMGLLVFADAHGNKFPSMVSITNGGAAEPMAAGDVVPAYFVFTNVIRASGIFICPTDKSRFPGRLGSTLVRSNVSYFISVDATPQNLPVTTILTGDRHLESGGSPVAPGLFTLSTNNSLAWTAELHAAKRQPAGGVLGFADGHVERTSLKSLPNVVANQIIATNRVVVP